MLTKAQLVAGAHDAGFPWANERLVTDWSDKGLLDHPDRSAKGSGGGRGPLYLYPDNQLPLFCSLLAKRAEVTHIEPLCNVPVFVWAYWGDDWVRLAQVRRALATWARADRHGAQRSWERSRRTARAILDRLAHPDSGREDRIRAEKVLTDQIYRGAVEPDVLGEVFQPLVRPRGLPSWRDNAAEATIGLAVARALAISRLHDVPDELFALARAAHVSAIVGYGLEWQRLSHEPEVGHLYDEPTMERLMNEACRHVLSVLGLLMLGGRAHLLGPGDYVTRFGHTEAQVTVTTKDPRSTRPASI